jgi:glycosyltransferase involved in cell wall biosynthesis
MRIAFLSVSAELGGSETSLLLLVQSIRRLEASWELTVIVPRDGALARRVRESGAHVRVLPMPAALARLGESGGTGGAAVARRGAALVAVARSLGGYRRALAATLADIGAQLIHTNGFKLHLLGAWAAADDVPVVWHLHEYVSPRPLTRRLLKRYVSRAVAVVANSESVAADLRGVFGATAAVHTIYNAVDLREFSPDGPSVDLDRLSGMPGAPLGTIRVGLLATFGRWKGHDPFLRAIQQVTRTAPVRGYIIGAPLYDTSGSQYTVDEIKRLAGDLGVAQHVGFTGFVERPAAALRSLDVVVHASTQPEPFGLVIVEGMACGRAVIVSRAGGAVELVEDGVTALTHAPGDAADLAAAIQRCAASADLRRALGARARAAAVARFDAATFGGAFADLYRDLQPAAVMQ